MGCMDVVFSVYLQNNGGLFRCRALESDGKECVPQVIRRLCVLCVCLVVGC